MPAATDQDAVQPPDAAQPQKAATRPVHVWMAFGVLIGMGRLLAPNIADVNDVSTGSVVTAMEWALSFWVGAGLVMLIVFAVRMTRDLVRELRQRPVPAGDTSPASE